MGLCQVTDVYGVYGRNNIDKWTDLNNDKDENAIKAKILSKIELCTERFYNRVRMCQYAIPFTGDAPLSVVDVVAKMVGIELYRGRGITDFVPLNPEQMVTSPVATHEKEVDLWIRNLLAGRIHLDLPLRSTTVPVVVNPRNADCCTDDNKPPYFRVCE